jgi:hypothetical protein
MLEIVLLAALSGVIGILIRAAMGGKSAMLCLIHSLVIGIILGVYAFYHIPVALASGILVLTARQYAIMFSVFAMFGYVASDVLESLTFIAKHPYNPMKMFAAIGMSLRRKKLE